MREPENPKPRPARLPERDSPPAHVRPTPARQMAGAELREPPPAAPDVAEVDLESGGTAWRVRVLGRSGSSARRSPPLLLLGFWRPGQEGEAPELEATVVARALSEVPRPQLRSALEGASPPAPPDRPRSFFEGTSQGRRGGGSRRTS